MNIILYNKLEFAEGVLIELRFELEDQSDSFNETVQFSDSEIKGLSSDEICVLAFKKLETFAVEFCNARNITCGSNQFIGFKLERPRHVSTEIELKRECYKDEPVYAVVKKISQYKDVIESVQHLVPTDSLGDFIFMGQGYSVKAKEKTEVEQLRELVENLMKERGTNEANS